jgi:hypothetical protein
MVVWVDWYFRVSMYDVIPAPKLSPTIPVPFSRRATLSPRSRLWTQQHHDILVRIIISCATCTMDTKEDTAVAMVEETAADTMTLENAITNVDVVDTANAGVPPSGETDLSANADGKLSCGGRRKCLSLAVLFFLMGAVPAGVTLGVTMTPSGGLVDSEKFVTAVPDGTAEMTTDPEVTDDSPESPAVRKSKVDQVIAYVVDASVSDLTALTTIGSPQNRAAIWMAETDAADTAVPAGNATVLEGYNYMVRYVMAVFYYSTGGDNWHVQYFAMTFAPVCDWNNVIIDGPDAYRQGIICDAETDVVFGLDFGT